MKLSKIIKRFRIDRPGKFRLADFDPADTCGLDIEKADAKAMLADGVERLSELQEKLYAQDRWAVLAVFQAMDAAGKDGAIKHVMSGVNPQGCQVHCLQGAERARSSITISSGASPRRCPSAAASASSTARTTRRCWWCACTRRFSTRQRLPHELRRQGHLGGALRGHPRLRAPPRAQRHRWC